MTYTFQYHPDIRKVDLPKIDNKSSLRIKKAIEERLSISPEKYAQPLRKTLKGYWKLRVGHYRVVFKITGMNIKILGIIHRKNIYSQIESRKR